MKLRFVSKNRIPPAWKPTFPLMWPFFFWSQTKRKSQPSRHLREMINVNDARNEIIQKAIFTRAVRSAVITSCPFLFQHCFCNLKGWGLREFCQRSYPCPPVPRLRSAAQSSARCLPLSSAGMLIIQQTVPPRSFCRQILRLPHLRLTDGPAVGMGRPRTVCIINGDWSAETRWVWSVGDVC